MAVIQCKMCGGTMDLPMNTMNTEQKICKTGISIHSILGSPEKNQCKTYQ